MSSVSYPAVLESFARIKWALQVVVICMYLLCFGYRSGRKMAVDVVRTNRKGLAPI